MLTGSESLAGGHQLAMGKRLWTRMEISTCKDLNIKGVAKPWRKRMTCSSVFCKNDPFYDLL